jgi:hypothetical protein
MLASHPKIFTGPETHFFELFDHRWHNKFLKSTRQKRNGMARYWSDEQFYGWVRELFWGGISNLPAPAVPPVIFLEKTPAHCLEAELIVRAFPRARFIHLIRDGRAVVASLIRMSGGRANSWASSRVSDGVKMWTHCVRAGQRIPGLVGDPSQYVELRYETLRQAPQEELAKLYRWMGLNADASLVEKIVEDNAIDNVLRSDKRFPSITRVDPTEDKFKGRFIGNGAVNPKDIRLTRWQRAKVELLARGLLRQLGYLS